MDEVAKKFEQAYRDYAKDIHRHASFKVKDKAAVDDLVQETFFKAWRYIVDENSKEILNIKSFLYKTLNNTIIDYYRSKKEQVPLEQAEEKDEAVIFENDYEQMIDVEIENKELLKNLSLIKKEYREILTMRYIDDLSISEISEIINKKSGLVRITIFRALKALKNKYEK